jgi:hypothetical protein
LSYLFPSIHSLLELPHDAATDSITGELNLIKEPVERGKRLDLFFFNIDGKKLRRKKPLSPSSLLSQYPTPTPPSQATRATSSSTASPSSSS